MYVLQFLEIFIVHYLLLYYYYYYCYYLYYFLLLLTNNNNNNNNNDNTQSVREQLARIAPTESVIVDRRNGIAREVTEERSPSEVGPAWASNDEVQIVRNWFGSRETRPVMLGSDKELQVNYSDRSSFAITGTKTFCQILILLCINIRIYTWK